MSASDETRDLFERARRTAEEARRVSAQTRQIVRTSRDLQLWTARVQGRLEGKSASFISFHWRSNQLLSLLPQGDFARLAPLLQGVKFRNKQVLHQANTPIDYVFFPLSGLLSAMVVMRDGGAIEVATIGNEGLAGMSACLGNGISPYNVVVQIPGEGLRIDVPSLRELLKEDGMLSSVLTDYQSVAMVQSAYQVACNGLHTVDKRCCRRLLSTQDRLAGASVLPLTHDSLALTLGVRRATVTDGLGQLQAQGVIECGRGNINILDRPKLQSLACECYQAIHDEYSRFFETADRTHGLA